jgi:hypothetical protein
MREKPVGVDWPNATPPNKQRAIAPIKEPRSRGARGVSGSFMADSDDSLKKFL